MGRERNNLRDRYWNAIVGNGGKESECGWCKDRWGLSWQIIPRALTEALSAGGGEAKRAFEAMMKMKKIDIALSRQRGADDVNHVRPALAAILVSNPRRNLGLPALG